jgi:benzoyl-CoA reductase/2-hydroxyglutaryl-CoA dehydratase subunit BcrC/BadD/HgdB
MKILSMSGFVPEAICDTVRFNGFKGDAGFSHYCTYASDYISQVLSDDTIDGAVFPKTCDSSRSISSYIGESGKFVYPLAVPVVRSVDAVKYYASVIRDYKTAVEAHYGISISEDEIYDRFRMVEARNASINSLYESLADGLSYSSYINAIHENFTKPLAEQKIETSGQSAGIPVFLLGSYMTNAGIVDSAEKNGLRITGDDLPESNRIAKRAFPVVEDIYQLVALQVLSSRTSPTQNSYSDRIKETMEEIGKKGCRGVLVVTQKFCEPYDYYYSVLKKALDDAGIPSLKLELDGSLDQNLHEAELGAFASMLEACHG